MRAFRGRDPAPGPSPNPPPRSGRRGLSLRGAPLRDLIKREPRRFIARHRPGSALPAAKDHVAIARIARALAIARLAAEKLVRAEPPEVAGAAHARAGDSRVRRLVVTALRGVQRLDPKIDLAYFEADRLDVEIQIDDSQRLQRFAEQPIVPDRDLGQTVVGDYERALLRLGEMFEANGRDFAPAQPPRGR